MRQVASKKLLGRALAVCLLIVAHAFLLNLGHPGTVALGLAYAGCAVGLAVAAGLLWYRTMD